jgi:hypothetical protein
VGKLGFVENLTAIGVLIVRTELTTSDVEGQDSLGRGVLGASPL